jgi:MFS family permease
MDPKKERTVLLALCGIMSVRMLGLFMILPIFSIAAEKMLGANPTLIGLALGIYGLTQAAFQIPLGTLSDRIGRKPVILGGLCVFFIGSLVAALSHAIDFLILGRALQGMGAVGSTVLALLADLTRDETRGKAMAFIGLSIGVAFTAAMVLGPIIHHWLHLSGIFWVTAGLAVCAIVLLTTVPTPPKPIQKNKTQLKKVFASVLTNKQLLRLDAGIFSLHAILTALFIAIPLMLTHQLQLSEWAQIGTYLGILLFSFACALPFIIIAEKKRKLKPIFTASVATIALVQLGLMTFHTTLLAILFLLFIFFTAFTVLEAILPSMISKNAPVQNKGAAMGVYSTSQFLGIFIGGGVGGLILSHASITGIFLFCTIIAVIWLLLALGMSKPNYLQTLITPVDMAAQHDYHYLSKLPGVADIAIASAESLLYVRFDKEKISEYELRNAVRAGNLT